MSDPTPRPPDTTAPADVNSSSDAATLSSIHSERETTSEFIFSIFALPDAATASKFAVRTEITFSDQKIQPFVLLLRR